MAKYKNSPQVIIHNNVSAGGYGGDGGTGLLWGIILIIALCAFVELWRLWVVMFTAGFITYAILKLVQKVRRINLEHKQALARLDAHKQYEQGAERWLNTQDMNWLDDHGYNPPTTRKMYLDDYDDGLDWR